MNRQDEFFIPDNEVKLSGELDYGRADLYISAVDALSRASCQSVYIIDYFKRDFLYVSPNRFFLCGLSQKRVRELGYRFYLDHVPEGELPLLLTINRAGFAFYEGIPVKERKEWYISCDFHILDNGRKTLVNHKMTPLELTSDGRIWLALCVVTAATHADAGHIEMHHAGTSDFYEYSVVSRKWKKKRMPVLTDGEKSVLMLSIQGYTMAEIADKICLSPDTVKKYRQRIFVKLKCAQCLRSHSGGYEQQATLSCRKGKVFGDGFTLRRYVYPLHGTIPKRVFLCSDAHLYTFGYG